MKINYLFFLFFVFNQHLIIAQKHDYHWVMGYGSNTVTTKNGGTNIDFNAEPPDTAYIFRDMNIISSNITMSDKNGQLLFYSNGCYLAGADDQPLLNGEGLNPGYVADSYCDHGYPVTQDALVFPDPYKDNLFHYFHLHLELDNNLGPISDALLYTLIDMNGDNGHGEVLLKNQIILEDTLWLGQLTATRHANGRDWWMLVPQYQSNRIHTFLFTPTGLIPISEQNFGDGFKDDVSGQAVFSPDGRTYARFDPKNKLYVFDFDRCSGLLSNPRFIDFDFDPLYHAAGGVAISPNSRYLYVSANVDAFQFDLHTNDIASSKILIAEYDGYASPFGSTFYMAQLAPNGKIYLNCTNSENVMHVIHEPNKAGLACNFEQHGFKLPTYNGISIPNFPNYRLGALVGSVCDSLPVNTHDEKGEKISLRISPNPVAAIAMLTLDHAKEKSYVFEVYDARGRMLLHQIIDGNSGTQELDLSTWSPGIYFYHLSTENKLLEIGKIICID